MVDYIVGNLDSTKNIQEGLFSERKGIRSVSVLCLCARQSRREIARLRGRERPTHRIINVDTLNSEHVESGERQADRGGCCFEHRMKSVNIPSVSDRNTYNTEVW